MIYKQYKDSSLDALLDFYRDVRETIRECLRRTPDDLLSWSPKEGMRTFGHLYVHFASPIDWWMTLHIKDGGRWTPSKDEPTDNTDMLDKHILESFARLEKFAQSNLSKIYCRDDNEFTGLWLIMHLLEHDIHHRGQVMTYLRMNNIAPPEV